jgi:hypothetical protein
MSQKLSSLRRRLVKVQQRMADIARREELADCNCPVTTFVTSGRPEEFESEMNLPCPSHGFRRLGRIIWIQSVAAENGAPKFDERIQQDDAEIERLLEIYEARLAEHDRQRLEKEEQEDGAEEL